MIARKKTVSKVSVTITVAAIVIPNGNSKSAELSGPRSSSSRGMAKTYELVC